jgi:hypothetical protein
MQVGNKGESSSKDLVVFRILCKRRSGLMN